MNKVLFAVVCVVLASSVALAQEYPKAEVFGGYSIERTGIPYEDIWGSEEDFEELMDLVGEIGGEADHDSSRFLKKGFQASVTFNMNEYLGVEASIRYHSGDVVTMRLDYPSTELGAQSATMSGTQSGFAFLAGPKVTLRKHERLIPFAHLLFGVDRAKVSNDLEGDVEYFENLMNYYGIEFEDDPEFEDSDAGFGMAIGGGVDLKMCDGFAIRLIQADYFLSKHHEDTLNNFDLAFGVVIRFGD